MKKAVIAVFFLLFGCTKFSAQKNVVPGEYIVRIKPEVQRYLLDNYSSINEIDSPSLAGFEEGSIKSLKLIYPLNENLSPAGKERLLKLGIDRTYLLKVSNELLDEEVLSQLGDVEPNQIFTSDYISNDTYYSDGSQYSLVDTSNELGNIHVKSVWEMEDLSRSDLEKINIIVMDSQVQWNHPDLILDETESQSFLTYSPNPNNPEGTHGSHVAGIACAQGGNSIGITGVMPHCNLINYTTSLRGSADTEALVKAYSHVVGKDFNSPVIINNSFGSSIFPKNHSDQITELAASLSDRALIVTAAGNNSNDRKVYPARLSETMPHVISVANTDRSGILHFSSNHGDWVDIAAPGTSIVSTINNKSYGYLTGTSMSAPTVAGAAGLLWSIALKKGLELSPAQIKELILSGARTNPNLTYRDEDGKTKEAVIDKRQLDVEGSYHKLLEIVPYEKEPVRINLAVTHGATFESINQFVPGTLLSAFGDFSGIADQEAQLNSAGQLPTNLGGVQVQLTQYAQVTWAPILYVSDTQINFWLPDSLSLFAPLTMDIVIGENDYIEVTAAPVKSDFELFFSQISGSSIAKAQSYENGSFSGNIIIENQGSLDVRSVVPIVQGQNSILSLFGTGFGGTIDSSTGRGLNEKARVSARIDGIPVNVLFAGPQGEYFGLDQINVELNSSLCDQRNELKTVEIFVDNFRSKTTSVKINGTTCSF